MTSLQLMRRTPLALALCVLFMRPPSAVAESPTAATASALAPAPMANSESTERRVARTGLVHIEQSRVYIHVDKTGLGHEHAVAGLLRTGNIQLDASENAGELVFEMGAFKADPDYARKYLGLKGVTDQATQQKVTANMLGRDVLDTAQFPTAKFQLTSALPTGKLSSRGLPTYELAGLFTLHGVTKPLRFLAEAEQRKSWTRVTGSFSIVQSDFGITPFKKAFGAVGVADRLTIHGDLWVASAAPVERTAIRSASSPEKRP